MQYLIDRITQIMQALPVASFLNYEFHS